MTKHKAISLVSLQDKYLILTPAPLFKTGKVIDTNGVWEIRPHTHLGTLKLNFYKLSKI